MVTPAKSDSLTPSTSSEDQEQGAGYLLSSRSSCFIGSSSSSTGSGSSSDCYASRVIWVAGMNGDPANETDGLKHIIQQIVGPGDHIFALVLFDNIPSELGISFAFTQGGFRSAAVPKMLKWLSQKLNIWQGYLQSMVAHCRDENVTLELRVCAGQSLGDTAVREAQFLQATDIILDRNEGNNSSPTKKVAKLLSENTDARVGLMQKREGLDKVEAVIQVPENCEPRDFSSHELLVDPYNQAFISNTLIGLNVICQESKDPFYLALSMDLLSSSLT